MSKFKVGDRVRAAVNLGNLVEGQVVEVTGESASHDNYLYVDDGLPYHDSVFELVEESDSINHPDHYKQLPVEAIEITEHFNFCMGNALKYIIRADHKGEPVKDLKKAIWYLQREVANRESAL